MREAPAGVTIRRFDMLAPAASMFMEAVKVVGCDRIVIGTDCGHFAFPAPVEAMRLFITGMLMRGSPDNDVEKMVKTNSSDLLY